MRHAGNIGVILVLTAIVSVLLMGFVGGATAAVVGGFVGALLVGLVMGATTR